MKKFANFLKSIDQFGSSIQLNYKQSYSLKTQFGGFFTIIAVFLAIVISYVFSRDIFVKDKPQTSFSKVARNISEVYLKDFPISITIADSYGTPVSNPQSLLEIYSYHYVIYQNSTNPLIFETYYNLTFKPCTNESYGKYNDVAIQSGRTPDAICMDYGEYTRFYNEFATMNSSFIAIGVDICTNSTRKEGNWCADQSLIHKFTSEFFVTVGFPDYVINPNLYDNPESLYFYTLTQRVSRGLKKLNSFKIRTVQIDTDNGWFQADLSSKYIKQLESNTLDMDLSEDKFYAISFESPKLCDLYGRTYVKIQTLLANIGGIMNIALVVCKVACEKVSEISFYLQESKDVLDFSLDDDGKYEENEKFEEQSISKTNITIIPFSKSKKDDELNLKRNASNELSKRAKAYQQKEEIKEAVSNIDSIKEKNQAEEKMKKYGNENKSKIGFIGYFKAKMSCKSKENYISDFYEHLISYLKKQLDICTIIKHSHDLDIMKYLLIGQDKACLFSLKAPLEEIFAKCDENDVNKKESEKEAEDQTNANDALEQQRVKKSLQSLRRNISSKKIFSTEIELYT